MGEWETNATGIRRGGPRDEDIVAFVHRFRQARAKQIERLFFADGSEASRGVRCRRTLLRLFNAGRLGRLERAVGGMTGSEGYIYQRARSRRRLPDLHALTIAEAYVRLCEAERTGAVNLLNFDPEPYSVRWVEKGDFEPDAFAEIGLPGRKGRWFIEVDEDTEDRGQMFGKLKQYAGAYKSWPSDWFPAVIFIAPNDRRKHLIEHWVRRQPEDMRHLFRVTTLGEAVDTMVSPSSG